MEITREIVQGMSPAVVLWPHPALRRPCPEIDSPGEAVALAGRMLDVLRALGGLGLAAPQVGVQARMFVWDVDGVSGSVLNPVLVAPSIRIDASEEGCLSLPGVAATVERHASATLVGVSADWSPLRAAGGGLLARVWQHELDHLDGLTLAERMSAADLVANSRALKRLRRAAPRKR
jgi:peptide deformylase